MSVSSPDGSIVLSFSTDSAGSPLWQASVDGKPFIEPSSLGFDLEAFPGGSSVPSVYALDDGMEVSSVKKGGEDYVWEQPWGENKTIRCHYNEMAVALSSDCGAFMTVRFRVFDDGIGFRYEVACPGADSLRVTEERTGFAFAKDGDSWSIPADFNTYELDYRKMPLAGLKDANTPMTFRTSEGIYGSIHEAALKDYPEMTLKADEASGSQAAAFTTSLAPWPDGVKARFAGDSFVTPWRTVQIGRKAVDLINSSLILNLNDPCELEDTEWIKPMKYVGIWWVLHKDEYTWYYGPRHGANTELTRHYIDFAAENGFAGVLVEGWNKGWEGNWMKTSENFSFTEAYPDYDFDTVMKYAGSKGVQMIIHNETAANLDHYFSQIDEAYTLYSRYGMHYVKTGNVNLLIDGKEEHDGQYGVNRLHAIVEKAAEYRICIDEHEPAMPTGVSRTWPNLMTHEAVRGQEHDAWEKDGGNTPEHTTVIPFIRGLAGPMDFTFGTFDFENPKYPFCRVNTTLAKQLALYVVIYSPLQMASDAPESYEGKKAFDFIRDVPCDWHESHVLDASIGDYIVTARRDRDSEDWYLGAITDENARDISVKLDFLDPDAEYTAQIYADGEEADWKTAPTAFRYEERSVDSGDILPMHLATSGGCAVRFIKK